MSGFDGLTIFHPEALLNTPPIPGAFQDNGDDTSPFATELKFVLASDVALLVRTWARREMAPDPHGIDANADAYWTRSLYFDTTDLDLYRRDSYRRAKFRIRNYNASTVFFFERKLKIGSRVFKRRWQAAREDVLHLAASTRVSEHSSWFERRLEHRRLRPICQVSYWRTARIAQTDAGEARLTVDDYLSAVPTPAIAFTQDAGIPILPGKSILELKYRSRVPVLFRRLIEEFRLAPHTISKYRLAISSLRLAPEGEETGMYA